MAEALEGTYKLAFTHGSHTDFETGLVINREDQVEVKEPIGKATMMAIANNKLLLVRDPKPAKKVEGK